MEEPKSKNKTTNPPRTIKGVAKDLRARGELNEDKWNSLTRETQRKVVWLSIILGVLGLVMYAKDGWAGLIAVFLCYLCLLWGHLSRSGVPLLIYLYTTGKKTVGEVTFAASDPRYGRGIPNQYVSKYKYTDLKNNTHEITFEPWNYVMAEVMRPKVGDMIDILFLEEAPEITMPYMEYLDKKYNLRKES